MTKVSEFKNENHFQEHHVKIQGQSNKKQVGPTFSGFKGFVCNWIKNISGGNATFGLLVGGLRMNCQLEKPVC